MSATPSPSKRARIPTSSANPSATASPFNQPSSSNPARLPHNGPRSGGPIGTSALSGFGVSPSDAFSPANMNALEGYAMTGLTPYSTTSPAYTANATAAVGGGAGLGGAMTAASPLSAALAHGSRVLSGIQAGSPFQGGGGSTPVMMGQQQGPYLGSRYTGGATPNNMPNQMIPLHHSMVIQPESSITKPAMTWPQQGSPEYLRTSLLHLQNVLLARLESESEAFFDCIDSALSENADTRLMASRAKSFESALESMLGYVEKNGLASIPLLPLPTESPESKSSTSSPSAAAVAVAAGMAKDEEEQASNPNQISIATAASAGAQNNDDEVKIETKLQNEIQRLQTQAKDLFDRRQRVRECARIVGGILDS